VTVELPDGVVVAEGDVHVFQVTAWIFGTGLAVRALSVGDGNTLTAAAAAASDDTARLRSRAAEADHVVSGVVRQVSHVPPEEDHPITEHDPQWNDATVEVQEKVGGTSEASPASVTVRFASSRDVRWQQAPKFTVGERGVWLLGAPQPAIPAVAAAAEALTDDHYLVVDPDDFHREEDEPVVKAALEGEATEQ
jgi:hypothetical protein